METDFTEKFFDFRIDGCSTNNYFLEFIAKRSVGFFLIVPNGIVDEWNAECPSHCAAVEHWLHLFSIHFSMISGTVKIQVGWISANALSKIFGEGIFLKMGVCASAEGCQKIERTAIGVSQGRKAIGGRCALLNAFQNRKRCFLPSCYP